MRIIFKIARAELMNLFYSPAAWLVLLFYCIICGFVFVYNVEGYFRLQTFMMQADASWPGFNGSGLTTILINGPAGRIITNFYLFIPLLTMGVINREISSGTYRLLYAAPIRIREIVLGKYLGLFGLVLILTLLLASILIITPTLIVEADGVRYLSTVLAVFLIANTYIAVGIFISALSNYQIVAGILTFTVFFILNSIGGLWQQYDFIRDITYFLSIADRADNLLNGLITSRDICYFLLITALFIGLTMIKLKSSQESKSWTVSFKRYMLLVTAILFAGYLSSMPGKVLYFDTTANDVNTISKATQDVFAEMDGSPLTVTLYTNLFHASAVHGLPRNRNYYIWSIWERYRRFYPNMVFKYVYYYDVKDGDSSLFKWNPNKDIHEIAAKFAKELGVQQSLFKNPEAIREMIDFEGEDMKLVMQLQYKDKKAWLRTFDDRTIWPNEDGFAGSIKRLTRVSPKVLFSIGNYERDPSKYGAREYGSHAMSPYNRNSLNNHGVDCDTISLDKRPLPDNLKILVVADPRSAPTTLKQQRIQNYINKGGNVLILGEPYKTAFLNPILQSTGVVLDEGMIVNANKDEMPHILDATINDVGAYLADENFMFTYKQYGKGRISAKLIGAANLSYNEMNGFKIAPILTLPGNENNWVEMGHLVVDSAAPAFSVLQGDYRKESYNIGVKLERSINNKQQKMIVTGDADMLSDERFGTQGLSYYSWLLNNEYPTYVRHELPADLYFNTSPITVKILSWMYCYIIPALVLILGIVLLLRRKRK